MPRSHCARCARTSTRRGGKRRSPTTLATSPRTDTPPAAARRKAHDDLERILPDGLATAGHAIYVLEHDGAAVGRLWLAERVMDDRRALFISDIHVEPAWRGHGLGRAAMLLVEDEARALGIARIELNVFGRNAVARRLYLSLGYVERAVLMAKDLA